MRWLLTLGLVLKSCSIIFCQAPNAFIHYTIEQGLSDNNVVDMVQDDVGFMWIATQNGLNRFDGVQFKTFFKNENNFDLPNNIITRIRKWRDHLLIIATRNGLGILNTQTGHCQAVMIPSQKEISQQTNFIECLQVTSNDEIVVGTHTGVYVYNRQLQMIAKTEAGYKPEDVGRRRFIFILGIALLNNGDFIAETAYGVQFYNHQRRIFSPLTGHANSVYRAAGLYLLRYPHHIFDIDRFNRLICINYREPRNQITVFDLTSGKITRSLCPCQNENDFNWSSKIAFHNDTLFSVNAINGGFYLFTYHPEMLEVSVNPVKILPGVFSNKLMLDSENRWWACTVNGLFSQSLIKQQFRNTSVTGYFDNKEMLEGVMAIYRYKKKLYVGLESIHGGIVVFDEKDQFIRKIDLSSLHPGCNMTWNIDRWGEDTLVVGTQAGVVLLNTNNYHFSRINYGGWPTAANEAPITLSYTDRHGTRWIGLGNTNGVMAFYPKTRTWKHFSSTDKSATFKLRYPLHIAEDKNGDVWMGHDEEGRFMRWSYRRQDFETVVRRFNSPKENFANSLTSDREGNLWLYQEDQGLLQWDPVKNTLKKYPFQGYWPNEHPRAIYTGISGQLWIILKQSLSVMNLRTGEVRTFTKTNGLPDYTATGFFYYDSLSQSLMIGFINSFTRFNPYEVFRKERPKKIFITEIKILNDTIQRDPHSVIRLKYSQNDIAIHFSAVDYENGQQNRYEYRLLRHQNSPWVDIGHQQFINLNNLPAGKYIFQVRLSSRTINNNEQIATASMVITPPFYRTGWFYTLTTILLASGVFMLYRLRIQQLIEVQKVRNRISSDLHDDIGSRLTNIQMLSALGEQKLEQPHQASVYLRRIVNEVQTSGEALDDIVWSINSRNDSGEELAARMRRYAAEVFEGDRIVCHMNVNDNFSEIKLSMEKRRDVYLVFKEALNNILKHSQASIVNIELFVQNNKVMMQIADNGRGFNINQTVHRNGIDNMKKRIQKWRGVFTIESATDKGTVLYILLPLREWSLKGIILKKLHLS